MRPYAFGVDVGGTTVKIGFFDTEANLLEKWEIPTRTENSGEYIVPDIAASLHEYMDKKGLKEEDIEGVGIDVPGVVLKRGLVNRCANLGWGVKHVKEEIAELMGGNMRIRIANDANAAAFAEMKKAGKGKNAVMVTLGTGVGGGVVVKGNIVTGAFGAGGEIGHMPVNPNETEVCGCGKRGCLEQYASATGVVRLAKKKMQAERVETAMRAFEPLTCRDVCNCAKEGDTAALEVLEEVGEITGRALASVACVVDPEVFVIGGGVSKAGPILTDVIQKYYKEYAFHASQDTAFVIASLGNDAGIYGAVQLVIAG